MSGSGSVVNIVRVSFVKSSQSAFREEHGVGFDESVVSD